VDDLVGTLHEVADDLLAEQVQAIGEAHAAAQVTMRRTADGPPVRPHRSNTIYEPMVYNGANPFLHPDVAAPGESRGSDGDDGDGDGEGEGDIGEGSAASAADVSGSHNPFHISVATVPSPVGW
jgi:hypothetical protein